MAFDLSLLMRSKWKFLTHDRDSFSYMTFTLGLEYVCLTSKSMSLRNSECIVFIIKIVHMRPMRSTQRIGQVVRLKQMDLRARSFPPVNDVIRDLEILATRLLQARGYAA